MYKLCVSGKKTFYSICLRDSTVQHWEESLFLTFFFFFSIGKKVLSPDSLYRTLPK